MVKIAPQSIFAKTAAVFFCLFLTGCTGSPLEKSFWVPLPATGAAPIETGTAYPIRRATGENLGEWPNLGDVPARPDLPKTAEASAFDQRDLEDERSRAIAADAALRANNSPATLYSADRKTSRITVPAVPPAVPAEILE